MADACDSAGFAEHFEVVLGFPLVQHVLLRGEVAQVSERHLDDEGVEGTVGVFDLLARHRLARAEEDVRWDAQNRAEDQQKDHVFVLAEVRERPDAELLLQVRLFFVFPEAVASETFPEAEPLCPTPNLA